MNADGTPDLGGIGDADDMPDIEETLAEDIRSEIATVMMEIRS